MSARVRDVCAAALRPGVERNNNLVNDGFSQSESPPKKTCGAASRRRYTSREKVGVIQELRDLESRSAEVRARFGMTPLFYLEHKSGISASNISKWQKDEDSLVQQAADKVRSCLMATCTRRRL
ncbi:unnamed protein product [Ectocarpus sp. CCAP 1310/34]|nr:unnamed protein product [Ectocarpus sp. CCAP 1310/34]